MADTDNEYLRSRRARAFEQSRTVILVVLTTLVFLIIAAYIAITFFGLKTYSDSEVKGGTGLLTFKIEDPYKEVSQYLDKLHLASETPERTAAIKEIKSSLSDGILTNAEFSDIRERYEEFTAANSKAELQKQIRSDHS